MAKVSIQSRFNRYLLWPTLLTAHFLVASLFAWHLLAQVNFAYPLGYELLDINEHIQTYGPQNRFKDHFASTSPAEHKQIFAQITEAIQNGGQGLAGIDYTLPDGGREPLMRDPEVVHLQDVAYLVQDLYRAGGVAAVLLVLTLAYAYRQRLRLPPARKLMLGFAGALALITLTVLIIGPIKVFYWLHDYVFPEDHPWFFYYQDSLMTTLMKAPDLFGFIAILLVVLIGIVWGLSLWGMARLLDRRATAGPARA